MAMKKLYKKSDEGWHYAEAWVADKVCTLHWGKVGEQGESEQTKVGMFSNAEKEIEKSLSVWRSKGYTEVGQQDQFLFVVSREIEGQWGKAEDLEERHLIEETLNESLGWTGNGHVDGGDIGMGEMSVFSIVVDPHAAKETVIFEFTEFDMLDGLSIKYRKIDEEDFHVLWTPEDSAALTAPPKPPENQEEWMAESNPIALQGALSESDLDIARCLQFAIACCDRIAEYLIHPDSKEILQYAKQVVEGKADPSQREHKEFAADAVLGNAAMMDFLESGDLETIREMEGNVAEIQELCDLAKQLEPMDSIVFSHAAEAASRLLSSEPDQVLYSQVSAAWAIGADNTSRLEEDEQKVQADMFREIFASPFR